MGERFRCGGIDPSVHFVAGPNEKSALTPVMSPEHVRRGGGRTEVLKRGREVV